MTIQYIKYLKSTQWAEIRNDLYTNRGKLCEICGSTKNIQIHHLNYDRIFNEEPSDLIILCSKCHMKAHSLFKPKVKRNKRYNKNKKRNKKKLKMLRKLERKWHSKSWNQQQQLKRS